MAHEDPVPASGATLTSPPIAEVVADAVLAAGITPNGLPAAVPGQVRSVLLTGATGFLGAFLLRELLDSTQADVWCLVRAVSEQHGLDRIADTMKRYLVWDESLSGRIRPILGDLAKPSLGLASGEWRRLAEEIDVIHHNGARVSHITSYGRLRDANVLGTMEILKLACTNRAKPVHFVSTAGIPGDVTDPGAAVREYGTALPGYLVSKWVAERLVAQAAERGLPARVYRPARISGHSATGACQSNDMVWNFVRAAALLGLAPDVPVAKVTEPGTAVPEVSFAPVDYVARAIVRLSTNDIDPEVEPAALRYLVNQSRMQLRDLIEYVSLRFPLKVVPADEWLDRVATGMDEHGSAMAAARLLLPSFRRLVAGANSPPVFDDQATVDELAGSDIVCPPIKHQLLSRYLDYFQSVGFLPGG